MRYTKNNDFRRNWKFHMENVIAFLFILFAAPAWCVADIQQDKDGNSVEFAYATMSDGVKIAVAVGYPKGFDPQDQAQKWPAMIGVGNWVCAKPDHWLYEGTGMKEDEKIEGLVGWEWHGHPAKDLPISEDGVHTNAEGQMILGKVTASGVEEFYNAYK